MEAGTVPTEPTQAAAPPAPAPAPEQPPAPSTPEPASSPPPSSPDLSEQVADLTQRLAKVEGTEPEAQPTDLLSALMGEPSPEPEPEGGSPAYTDQQLQELQAAGYDIRPLLGQAQPIDPRDQRIEELAQQVQQMTERELDGQLNALEEKYPDILEPAIFAPLQQRLQSLAQRHGDQVLTDPEVVETAYQAVKAQQADAAAVPAQQAAKSGATLETGASRTQAGDEDPSAQYADKLLGTGGGSAFTR